MNDDSRVAWRRGLAGAALLGLFAVIGAGTLAITERLTRERIAEREQAHALDTLNEVVAPERYDNDLLDDAITVLGPELLGTTAPVTVYRAWRAGQPVAAILMPVAPDGYSGPIRLMVGINVDGSISGVRVVAHRETPGLGDGIEIGKSDWILQFAGRSIDNPEAWQVSGGGAAFDSLSGATVTSRAVVEAVRDALLYFEAHRDEIFNVPADSTAR
ncbi:MAG: electron transport complex subunit RsxG [Gammaproteobacteria bacterium]